MLLVAERQALANKLAKLGICVERLRGMGLP